MFAYDLDGVLAQGPPPTAKRWGKMSGGERAARRGELVRWYRTAPRIYDPPQRKFAVITARKDEPEVRLATQQWLEETFPGRVFRLHLLSHSRTVENVVRFKAGAIRFEGYEDFVEDNRDVVRGVALVVPECRVWLFRLAEGRGALERWPGPAEGKGAISRP